ncbi:MAG: aspartyl protease family protein [Marinicella sp.]
MNKILMLLWILFTFISAVANPQLNFKTALHQSDAGHFYIEVNINQSGPYRLIVDTAASVSFLRNDVIAQLKLPQVAGKQLSVEGAGGLMTSQYHQINSLSIGHQDFTDVMMVGQLSPDWPDFGLEIHGILGFDIFGQHNLLFLQSAQQLQFIAQSDVAFNPTAEWQQTAFDSFYGFMFIELTVNELTVNALFDTGAARIIMKNSVAKEIEALHDHQLKVVKGKSIKGLDNTEHPSLKAENMSLDFNSRRVSGLDISLADIPILDTLSSWSKDISVILGSPFMHDLDMYIDYTNQLIWFRAKTYVNKLNEN